MFYSIAEFSILRRKHNFTMKKCSKRIYWIDGLRGFACLMIFSVTSYIFMKAYSVSGRYQMSAGVSFLISLVLIILLAWLFNKYVEKACGKLIGIVVKWIYETEKK